ncbi:cAMP-binding protein, partial [Leptospira sp. 96542]|nr:cAMP-binding protein [Leptospira sp. 96542]
NRIKITPKQAYNFEIGTKDLLKMVGLTDPKDELIIADLMKNNKFIRLDMGKIVCSDMAELEKLVQFYHKKASMENKLKKLK